MPVIQVQRVLPAAALAAFATALAGCSGTTYGTGVTPEKQTLEDVMSIVALGSKKEPPIEYRPRGGIVEPADKTLRPPVETASVEADPSWPKDPDAERRKRLAEEANAPIDQPAPQFRLGKGMTSIGNNGVTPMAEPLSKSEAAKKAWAEKRQTKGGSYDAEGRPTRRFLTEPPVAYREPDPNSPTTAPEPAKKKWKIPNLWPF